MLHLLATIEIPKNCSYKYEIDKELQVLKLDRVMPIPCPFNYGYIHGFMSGDGDPLDVFVVSEFPINPLTNVEIVPYAILICEDNGFEDNKVIATIKNDRIHSYKWDQEIRFYLNNYKTGFIIKDMKLVSDSNDLKQYLTT